MSVEYRRVIAKVVAFVQGRVAWLIVFLCFVNYFFSHIPDMDFVNQSCPFFKKY